MSDAADDDNAAAFERLLQAIDRVAGDERSRGSRFENLIRDFLTRDPLWADQFTAVQSFAQWAEHCGGDPQVAALTSALGRRDTGIDLVGTNAADGRYTAIQCKYYAPDAGIAKAGIDSFISASNHPELFTQRLLITTSTRFTAQARHELRAKQPPVMLLTRHDLAGAGLDWAQYLQGRVRRTSRRQLRDYQQAAVEAVCSGLREQERGQLIMACGSGKTFTALRIAEELAQGRGPVLFAVPSLSLLSQSLSDWKRQAARPLTALAVCSDQATGRVGMDDAADITRPDELPYPATTEAAALGAQYRRLQRRRRDGEGLCVIFATYHSLGVVSAAQQEHGLDEFALIICDEAHRTTGYRGSTREREPMFVRVHDGQFIRAERRLYMTATPRIYGEAPRKQEAEGRIAQLYSMDDEQLYGPVLYTFTFNEAVLKGCLVDYQVIVLAMSRESLGADFERAVEEAAAQGGLSVSHAAKVIGCYRALAKQGLEKEISLHDDSAPMHRAVAFAQTINPSARAASVSSRQFAREFPALVARFRGAELSRCATPQQRHEVEQRYTLSCSCEHIDGGMDALEKERRLSWLRGEVEAGECRLLFNVRCLSEGVDVPALDAVIFLAPRRSAIDVIQAVGRVMRTAPGKRRGYVILPIVIPEGLDAADTLSDNRDFATIVQVLGALKSLDANFGAKIDGQLQQINPEYFTILAYNHELPTGRGTGEGAGSGGEGGGGEGLQSSFAYRSHVAEEQIAALLVRKLGNRREWGEWAADAGSLCRAQAARIGQLLQSSPQAAARFGEFAAALRHTLHAGLSDGELIEMLAQHLVIRPVVAELFREYPFAERNPLSQALSAMLEALQEAGLPPADRALSGFAEALRYRMRGIRTAAQRQSVILELFDKFFAQAFPQLRERLGIVYTPVELVDFILRSADELLRREFATALGDAGVHICDPFAGTGTFLTRLLQSGLIPRERLRDKYLHELHAAEIVPLAYYIACMNLESAYHELSCESEYEPNAALIFTDSFASPPAEATELFSSGLVENDTRRRRLMQAPLRVIISNPPYSVGQKSANDDNQNAAYPDLDARIAETYARDSAATNKNSLYDSYIRALRLASDRLQRGVIGFVTNASWLDGQSAAGLRQCLSAEFAAIYVYNLRGNARTSGEQRRRERDNVFGEGSRAPIALTLLVKNPEHEGPARIHYYAVGDYLSREDKLSQLRAHASLSHVPWQVLQPDHHGDWLNLRDPGFDKFLALGDKRGGGAALFGGYSRGLETSRDAWCYNSERAALARHMDRCIACYNAEVKACAADPGHELDLDKRHISWTDPLKAKARKDLQAAAFDAAHMVRALYRPFYPQHVYFDKFWNHRPGMFSVLFGEHCEHDNLCLCVNADYASFEDSGFIALMCDRIPDLHFYGTCQCFPRYLYAPDPVQDTLLPGGGRREVLTEAGVEHFQEAYRHGAEHIDAEAVFYYVYGLLHSTDYLQRYAASLHKQLPRIPRVATLGQFQAFARAGRQLAALHTSWEQVAPYDGCELITHGTPDYRVDKLRYGLGGDKSTLIYNHTLTIRGIPPQAQEYVVNRKSALDWVVERCGVRTDRDSGIINDFNAWIRESGDEQWLLNHILRVITISLETMRIAAGLPALEIHKADQ